jgi:hypothetical protein
MYFNYKTTYSEGNLVREFVGTGLGASDNPFVVDHGPSTAHKHVKRQTRQRQLG